MAKKGTAPLDPECVPKKKKGNTPAAKAIGSHSGGGFVQKVARPGIGVGKGGGSSGRIKKKMGSTFVKK